MVRLSNSDLRAQGFSSFHTVLLSVIAFSAYDFHLQMFKMDVMPPGISSQITKVLITFFFFQEEVKCFSQESSTPFLLLERIGLHGHGQLQGILGKHIPTFQSLEWASTKKLQNSQNPPPTFFKLHFR